MNNYELARSHRIYFIEGIYKYSSIYKPYSSENMTSYPKYVVKYNGKSLSSSEASTDNLGSDCGVGFYFMVKRGAHINRYPGSGIFITLFEDKVEPFYFCTWTDLLGYNAYQNSPSKVVGGKLVKYLNTFSDEYKDFILENDYISDCLSMNLR